MRIVLLAAIHHQIVRLRGAVMEEFLQIVFVGGLYKRRVCVAAFIVRGASTVRA